MSEVELAVRAKGQRMTHPRRLVLAVLAQADRPLQAEEIRRSAGLAESDLVTVYRNLEAIRALGFIQRIVLEDGVQLFEAVRAHGHHHHIICRKCHATEPLNACFGNELESRAQLAGFSEVEHVIEVFGVCSECRDKSGTD